MDSQSNRMQSPTRYTMTLSFVYFPREAYLDFFGFSIIWFGMLCVSSSPAH